MPAVIRHYHGLIACTISVLTFQPPWNFQLQQQEQTPCSQQIQISQKQNKTGFSCVFIAAAYPKIGELLTSPPSEPYKQTLPWSEATHIPFQPELSKVTFSAQTEILIFMINMVDLEDFPFMQGTLNSLVKGFVHFVFFHVLDTVVQNIFRQTGLCPCCNYCMYTWALTARIANMSVWSSRILKLIVLQALPLSP